MYTGFIKEENINNFDPAFLNGVRRRIGVTGKVFEYMGKPTIEITKEIKFKDGQINSVGLNFYNLYFIKFSLRHVIYSVTKYY